MAWRGSWRSLQLGLIVLAASINPALAQVEYSVHFEMDKPQHLLGEPIFCRFVIRNTGTRVFAFRYRTPTRSPAPDYEQEPRFAVKDAEGRSLPDPGPRPCGSAPGTMVYGSVTLPPGHVHAENWLLNQWAQFAAPGRYHVRAERRLALLLPGPHPGEFEEKPAAYALALDEFSVQVVPATRAQLEAAFRPYLSAVQDPQNPNPAQAVTVLTSLPQPFFLDPLVAMTKAANAQRWDRRDALDGLARLNTAASWRAILNLFRSGDASNSAGKEAGVEVEDPARSHALQLLAEKGDPAFIPVFVGMLAKSHEPMRGDILRSLGFFHDVRAYQPLYDNLHSTAVTDRMNAILGLKNLGGKEVIPALLAALNDPEAQVRQVANFALEGLTGHQAANSADSTRGGVERVASDWHAWWRAHAGSFSPPRPPACHDW